jgi:cobalt/nickel transport protein
MISTRKFLIIGLTLALLIGGTAVFLASSDPDGLESTALVTQGDKTLTGNTPPDAEVHEDQPGTFSYESPMPDYSLGEDMGKPGEILAIVGGILAIFGIVFGVSRLLAHPVEKD